MKQFRVIISSEIYSCDATVSEKRVIPFLKNMRKNLSRRRAKLYLQASKEWNHLILREAKVLDKSTWKMIKRRAAAEGFFPVKVKIQEVAA